jgi:hypothetical protein
MIRRRVMSRPVRLERYDVFRFRYHTEPTSPRSVAFVLRQERATGPPPRRQPAAHPGAAHSTRRRVPGRPPELNSDGGSSPPLSLLKEMEYLTTVALDPDP